MIPSNLFFLFLELSHSLVKNTQTPVVGTFQETSQGYQMSAMSSADLLMLHGV